MRSIVPSWVGVWVLFSLGAALPATAQEVRVMTRNQYVGTDMAPFMSASTPQEFSARLESGLAKIAAANFPERAQALAREIADKKPHLVGLQEAYRFTLNGQTGAPPFRDHLDDLLAALASSGSDYYVAAQVVNLHLMLPSAAGIVEVIDRIAVLARSDVAASPVTVPGCRVSGDGCNYNVVAVFNSPLGVIAIERGFVIVDAVIGGRAIRFANTHLEIPELPLILQSAQAAQLVATLGALPNPAGMPVIITGDMNSAPTDEPIVFGEMTIVPPYRQFASAGYVDSWLLRPGTPAGFTCCESESLLNVESWRFKRIDLVWTSVRPPTIGANLVGADVEDRTASGLWPSDHAGVFVRLVYQ